MMNAPMAHAPRVIAAYDGNAEEMVPRLDQECSIWRMGDAWDVAYAAPAKLASSKDARDNRSPLDGEEEWNPIASTASAALTGSCCDRATTLGPG
jgi:hypothetical protein